MPQLNTNLHLNMHRAGRQMRTFHTRLKRVWNVLRARNDVYGLEWGDPESCEPLRYFRDHFLRPYINPHTTVLEIGPGGVDGPDTCWKQSESMRSIIIKNNGDDFPGIQDGSVDFVFSFGVFVHLDTDIISRYLNNMKRLLHPDSIVVIEYGDKTKPLGEKNTGFSENDPETMRKIVLSHGYRIVEEDTQSMWNGCMIRLGPPIPEGELA